MGYLQRNKSWQNLLFTDSIEIISCNRVLGHLPIYVHTRTPKIMYKLEKKSSMSNSRISLSTGCANSYPEITIDSVINVPFVYLLPLLQDQEFHLSAQ